MVSAVLISWKRQKNVTKIVEHLLSKPFIDEIIIVDNSKGENLKCYGRYVAASRARNDIIYTQDDDCIVHGIDALCAAFDGTQIVHGATPELMAVQDANFFGSANMAMAGWGYVFKKEWIPTLDTYIAEYGKDAVLYREADRIFSMLQNKHHKIIEAGIEHLDGYRGDEAMSSEADHLECKDLAIQRCLKLLGV